MRPRESADGKLFVEQIKTLLTTRETYGIIEPSKGTRKEVTAMLKFYTIHYTTYYKGKKVAHRVAHCLCDESKVDNWRVKVTWDNLAELRERIGGAGCGFTVWNLKRGRELSFSNTWPWQEPKEWKHADPQVEIECCWSEREVSIQDIMEWHDSEKAFQYLAERNLRIGIDK